jgi:hypothetical protein
MANNPVRFQMTIDRHTIDRLDEWRRKQPGRLSRVEAVRRLIRAMLLILDMDPEKPQ